MVLLGVTAVVAVFAGSWLCHLASTRLRADRPEYPTRRPPRWPYERPVHSPRGGRGAVLSPAAWPPTRRRACGLPSAARDTEQLFVLAQSAYRHGHHRPRSPASTTN